MLTQCVKREKMNTKKAIRNVCWKFFYYSLCLENRRRKEIARKKSSTIRWVTKQTYWHHLPWYLKASYTVKQDCIIMRVCIKYFNRVWARLKDCENHWGKYECWIFWRQSRVTVCVKDYVITARRPSPPAATTTVRERQDFWWEFI